MGKKFANLADVQKAFKKAVAEKCVKNKALQTFLNNLT